MCSIGTSSRFPKRLKSSKHSKHRKNSWPPTRSTPSPSSSSETAVSSTACRRNPPYRRMHPTPGAAEARLGHSPSTNAKGPTSTLLTSLSLAIDRHTRVQLRTLP